MSLVLPLALTITTAALWLGSLVSIVNFVISFSLTILFTRALTAPSVIPTSLARLTLLINQKGELFIGEISAELLAKKFGTPLYVINEQRLRENYKRLTAAIQKYYPTFHIYYAMKANSNLNVLKILRSEGAFVDAVSVNEVLTAKAAGFKPNQILFTGTNTTTEDLENLANEEVTLNLDSSSQFLRLLKLKKPNLISFRINPDFGAGHHSHLITGGKDSKFGVWEDEALELYKLAKQAGIKKFGIHMHVGSSIFNISDFKKAVLKFMAIVGRIKSQVGIGFEFIDIGGGLGTPYSPEINKHKNFAGVDAGMNTLIRPSMYDSYHHILVNRKLNQKPVEKYDVVGPICESGDFFAKDRNLPRLVEGDLLAILTAGAYGYTMSSIYNLRERPAEILVNESSYELVREREKLDLKAGQKIAQWLE
ncbi:diaminopimelate decarboxylase [Candidatus Micrarchaeota archaeon]|nr:diaminopimelate decarboxylase [Candidatus Micrarchaeota archaeon]